MTNRIDDTSSIDELMKEQASATAVCRTCGTRASIDLQQLRGSFGGSVALRRIAFRIMCTGCGAADCDTTVLPQPPN